MTAPIESVSFVVLGPPQPKQRARMGKGGHWFTPAATRAYEQAVRFVGSYVSPTWRKDKRYDVVVRAYFADARRRDADNVAKAVADALNGVYWDDDSQIRSLTCVREVDRDEPRTEVEITMLDQVMPVKRRPTRREGMTHQGVAPGCLVGGCDGACEPLLAKVKRRRAR